MKEKDLASSIIQKMFWTIIILIVALVGSNLAWLWYINQYDFTTETETTTLDGTGTNNYIGNNGDIKNGDKSN